MRQEWLAAQRRIVRLPKFRRLSREAQLALFYVWSLAGDQHVAPPPEGPCRICGGHVTDKDSDVRVGPGCIEHAAG